MHIIKLKEDDNAMNIIAGEIINMFLNTKYFENGELVEDPIYNYISVDLGDLLYEPQLNYISLVINCKENNKIRNDITPTVLNRHLKNLYNIIVKKFKHITKAILPSSTYGFHATTKTTLPTFKVNKSSDYKMLEKTASFTVCLHFTDRTRTPSLIFCETDYENSCDNFLSDRIVEIKGGDLVYNLHTLFVDTTNYFTDDVPKQILGFPNFNYISMVKNGQLANFVIDLDTPFPVDSLLVKWFNKTVNKTTISKRLLQSYTLVNLKKLYQYSKPDIYKIEWKDVVLHDCDENTAWYIKLADETLVDRIYPNGKVNPRCFITGEPIIGNCYVYDIYKQYITKEIDPKLLDTYLENGYQQIRKEEYLQRLYCMWSFGNYLSSLQTVPHMDYNDFRKLFIEKSKKSKSLPKTLFVCKILEHKTPLHIVVSKRTYENVFIRKDLNNYDSSGLQEQRFFTHPYEMLFNFAGLSFIKYSTVCPNSTISVIKKSNIPTDLKEFLISLKNNKLVPILKQANDVLNIVYTLPKNEEGQYILVTSLDMLLMHNHIEKYITNPKNTIVICNISK